MTGTVPPARASAASSPSRPDTVFGDERPGCTPARLARLCKEAIARCALDLRGVRVLTEAASGPYVVTPVLAALAGADVVAATRTTRYGTVEDISAGTYSLADHLGVRDRVTVTDASSPELFARADVVTNSGHLRPIDGARAAAIRSDAVVTLMFEAWEIQAGRIDIDLDGLRSRGVRIAGTNERHPDVDVFGFLGPMAVAQLSDAGVSAYRGTVGLVCDNTFRPYLEHGLRAGGAEVHGADHLAALRGTPASGAMTFDAIVVALRPTGASVLSGDDIREIAMRWPDAVVVQFWGDVDREACNHSQVRYWPPSSPGAGHMGVAMSRLGPEAVVRLQTAGLKVGQVLRIPDAERTAADLAYLDPLPA